MASLLNLPVELITQIALETSQVSERDLFMAKSYDELFIQNETMLSLALVCKPLYMVLRHLRFRMMRVPVALDDMSTKALKKVRKRIEYIHSKVKAGSVKLLYLVGSCQQLSLLASHTSMLKRLFTSPALQAVTTLGLESVEDYFPRIRWLPRDRVRTVLLTDVDDCDFPQINHSAMLDFLASMPSLQGTLLNYSGEDELHVPDRAKLQALRILGSPPLPFSTPLLGLTMLEIDHLQVEAVLDILCDEGCNLPQLQILAVCGYFHDFESEDPNHDFQLPTLVSLCPNLQEFLCTDLGNAPIYILLDALPETLNVLSGNLYTAYDIQVILGVIGALIASGKSLRYILRLDIRDTALQNYISYCLKKGEVFHWLPCVPFECDLEEQVALIRHALGDVLRKTLDYYGIRYDTSKWPSDLVAKPCNLRQRRM
jgi:hypothetical protein